VIDAPERADTVQQPATLWVPERRGSYGDIVIDFATQIGIQTDPEQRRDIDIMSSFGPGGRFLTLESCIVEGRQNGKTKSVVLPIALADLFVFNDKKQRDRIIWTSHLMSTSMDTFKRIEELIEANPSLSRRVKSVTKSKTEQGFHLHDGSSLEFFARSIGGGRGLGGKRIVFDEALFLGASPLGALLPTLRARPNPQVTYASSAGVAESAQLRSLQARGRRGGDQSLTFIEYRAPGKWSEPGCKTNRCQHIYGTPGCVFDNETYWRMANHAIGRGRILLDTVRGERQALGHTAAGVLEFGRECLGWEQEGDDADRPISLDDWSRTAIPAGFGPGPLRRPVFYLDVSPGGRSATIGTASDRVDGSGAHVELAAHRLGAEWLVARAVELKKRHPRAVFGGSTVGGIKAYLPALDKAGIKVHKGDGPPKSGELVLFTDAQLAAGCTHLQGLATRRPFRMTHSDNPLFITALEGAALKDVGDGLWLWTRRGEQLVELSPLYGITGALWLLETTRPGDYDLTRSVY
jgi:hypothetical protein